jgi:ABC-2 type transport system ATP-binding protein
MHGSSANAVDRLFGGMTPEVSVRTAGLGKDYGAVQALDGVDLDLSGPRILGVVGPNGSGKTTLVECLLGLTRPTAGEASLNGVDSGALGPEDRRPVGYMPQSEAVYRDLTVRENVAFFARLYGVPDRATAVDRALAFVDLDGRADARIGELSGGMVRRTSLASAVVHDPAVLVLDEPTVGLDPKLRAEMWEGFRERRERGALVVVSTHYLGEAERCDEVLFLREGSVLALDTPAALMERTDTSDLEAAFLALLDEGAREVSA